MSLSLTQVRCHNQNLSTDSSSHGLCRMKWQRTMKRGRARSASGSRWLGYAYFVPCSQRQGTPEVL